MPWPDETDFALHSGSKFPGWLAAFSRALNERRTEIGLNAVDITYKDDLSHKNYPEAADFAGMQLRGRGIRQWYTDIRDGLTDMLVSSSFASSMGYFVSLPNYERITSEQVTGVSGPLSFSDFEPYNAAHWKALKTAFETLVIARDHGVRFSIQITGRYAGYGYIPSFYMGYVNNEWLNSRMNGLWIPTIEESNDTQQLLWIQAFYAVDGQVSGWFVGGLHIHLCALLFNVSIGGGSLLSACINMSRGIFTDQGTEYPHCSTTALIAGHEVIVGMDQPTEQLIDITEQVGSPIMVELNTTPPFSNFSRFHGLSGLNVICGLGMPTYDFKTYILYIPDFTDQ